MQNSPFNRRVTPLTPIEIVGPGARQRAAEDDVLARRHGARAARINNCGSGYTPWGTYLTGEENWFGYFTRAATDNAARATTRA